MGEYGPFTGAQSKKASRKTYFDADVGSPEKVFMWDVIYAINRGDMNTPRKFIEGLKLIRDGAQYMDPELSAIARKFLDVLDKKEDG